MQTLVYNITVPILYLISYLPMRVLYFISDFLVFPLLFYVLKYRREVTQENLRKSFPGQDTGEIEKEFYHFLSDIFLETVKSFTISNKELSKRVNNSDLSILEKHFNKGQSVQVTMGHYGNYEWGSLYFCGHVKHKALVPFRKFTNPKFQTLFTKTRSRFGGEFFSSRITKMVIERNKNIPFSLCLANDQNAPKLASFWTYFLNQETSFYKGTEKMAVEYNLPVYFGEVNRIKRGYYELKLTLITENPKEEKPGFILTKHAQLLENQILKDPAYWLWSHKRWKHTRPADIEIGELK